MTNKAKLTENAASSTGLAKKDAIVTIDAVFSTIRETLVEGERVQLIGLSSSEICKRAARKGCSPQTRRETQITTSRVPTFKPGKALRDTVK